MRAPRLTACSCDSRINVPAPSPGTNPSLSRSNGRLAFSGASLRVDKARIALNDAMPTSHSDASVPPASITSASPC
jgi:hypothetical protein